MESMMLNRILVIGACAMLLSAAPVLSVNSAAQTPSVFQVLASSRQVASPLDTGLPTTAHQFANLSEFEQATVPDSRQYYVVSGQLDPTGHWLYPFPVNMWGPVYSEELAIDLLTHQIVVGIGEMSPTAVAQLAQGSSVDASPMNSGSYAGQMTYNLKYSQSGWTAVVNCMAMGYSWNSGTNTVSNFTLQDCGSRGDNLGWSGMSGTVSLGYYSYGYKVDFDKNSEYHHLNQFNDSTYNCEADYNAITATGHSNGSTTNTTPSYIPVLWSPDGSDSNCPGEYYTVVTWA